MILLYIFKSDILCKKNNDSTAKFELKSRLVTTGKATKHYIKGSLGFNDFITLL